MRNGFSLSLAEKSLLGCNKHEKCQPQRQWGGGMQLSVSKGLGENSQLSLFRCSLSSCWDKQDLSALAPGWALFSAEGVAFTPKGPVFSSGPPHSGVFHA